MIEKDNIQELFSKAFENHASPVRPDLWTGVQAKMAAAGMTGGAVAAKGISALAKWLIGTAAVTTVGVTAYVVTNTNEADKPKQEIQITSSNGIADDKTLTTLPESIAETKPTTQNEQKENDVIVKTDNNRNEIIRQRSHAGVSLGYFTEDPFLIIQDELKDPVVGTSSGNGSESAAGNTGTTSGNGTTQSSSTNKTIGNKESEIKTPVVEETKAPAAKIELPNIFTPNNDRANDFCEFVAIENVKMVDITILDADGKTVFKSNDLNFKWDGTNLGGEQAKIGIYTCLISYVDLGDVAKNKTAYIYLQR